MIIYEDIDRITDEKNIKKIFAISEKLSSDKIRIIYQYEQENLEQLGLNREYLEKYIPFVVNLTDIEYRDIVKSLWDELKMEDMNIKQNEIIDVPYYISSDWEVEKILGINIKINVGFYSISIRKVRIFMEELKCILQNNEYLFKEDNRKTVIRFLFIKNFLYEYYEKFVIGKKIEETLMFSYQDCNYTMNELLHKRIDGELSNEDVNNIFFDKKNKDVYTIFMLLEYNFIIENKKMSCEDIANESVLILKKKERGERINRIIWNILGNGKSEFTNMKNAVDKFIKDVLEVQGDEQMQAWGKYHNDLYNQNLKKDNGTIFRIGINYFLALFQGFRVTDVPEEKWVQLIRFYNNYNKLNKKKIITVEFIESLNYCDLTKRIVFLEAIKTFCEYEIVGNMNDAKGYQLFWENYFSPVFYFGYSRRCEFEPWRFEIQGTIADNIDFFIKQLEYMEEIMKQEKKKIYISKVKEECDLIIKFIQKNRQLISEEKKIKLNRWKVDTKSYTVRECQEEYDRLLSYLSEEMTENDKKIFIDKLEESYEKTQISPNDLRDIMNEFERLNGKIM